MKIGQVSRLLGVSTSALRFYERAGVVRGAELNRGLNNYREYSEADVETFRIILSLKDAGFRLSDIGHISTNVHNGCNFLEIAAEEQLVVLEKTIAELMTRRDGLKRVLAKCKDDCSPQGNLECIPKNASPPVATQMKVSKMDCGILTSSST